MRSKRVTHIVELRKEPRPANPAPEGQSDRTHQIPSTHIPAYIQKVLGLAPASENTTT